MLRLLWRLVLGSLALCLAIPFGSFLFAAGIVTDAELRGLVGGIIGGGLKTGFWDLVQRFSSEAIVEATLGFAKSVLLLLSVPPALAATIGETLRFRSLIWYGAVSGGLTAALPWVARSGLRLPSGPDAQAGDLRLTALLFLAGSAAGLAYWLVAGWSAGRRREAMSESIGPLALPPNTNETRSYSTTVKKNLSAM